MLRRTALLLLLPIAGCLTAAASAHADATVTLTGGATVTVAADGAPDQISVSYAAPTVTVTRTGGGLTPLAGCAGGPAVVTCPAAAAVTLVAVSLADGADSVVAASLPPAAHLEADGGPGPDLLQAVAANDVLSGGPGDDVLVGGLGNDTLDGGDDADVFPAQGAADGADVIKGGDGADAASYAGRTAGLTVTIGAGADDGEPGEGDDVRDDVEDVAGGSGNDQVTGTGTPNVLTGGAGNDKLTGEGGADDLIGEDGDDELIGQDGVRDRLLCGAGTDKGTADLVDIRTDCENVGFNDLAQPDRDGDGVTVAAGDCNDADATTYAGAPDFFNNNVDEDCVGGDAKNPDVDGDGYLVPIDCNDRDPTIKPTATEVFGNSIDENCDRRTERLQTFKIGLSNNWDPAGGRTRVITLTVRGLPIETTVRIRCRGGGCPFKSKTRLVQGRNEPQFLAPLFKRRRLAAGARIEIRISKPGGFVTLFERFTTQRRAVPVRKTTCLRPGETKERKC